MITLGTTSAAPGEMDVGRSEAGESRDGGSVGPPVAVIDGASLGKAFYMQAASDGDELNGAGVIQRVVSQPDPADISGAISVIGIVNYHVFQVAQHRNPIDDTKMNRVYSGDERGTSSERIAAATFAAARDTDPIVNLHQGSTSRMIDEVRVRCGRHHRMHAKCLRLAKTFGCGYVLDQKGPDGQLARTGPDAGVPTIDPELGGCVGWDEESTEKGVRSVHNVPRGYDFLDGDVGLKAQTCIRDFDQYGSSVGGPVRFKCDLGKRISAGDVVFETADVFGTPKVRVTADHSGIFWRARRLPQVVSGEYVCPVGIDLDAY